MNFEYQINALLADLGGHFYFEDLEPKMRRELTELYIRENEDAIFDIFAGVHETSIANHFADLAISVDQCDLHALANDLRYAINKSTDVAALINGEIDQRYATWNRFREIEAAEHLADALR